MSTSRLDTLKKFLEEDPNDSFSYYAIALEYASMKMYPEAVSKYQELIERDPNYVPAHYQLGILLAQLSKIAEARMAFELGIKIATVQGDTHARNEMQEALDELDK